MNTKPKTLDEKQIAIYLNHSEYSSMYGSLKFRNTCQVLDDRERVNIFVRIDEAYQLEDAVKYITMLDVSRGYYDPWFVMNLIGFSDIYTLAFRLDSEVDKCIINRMLETEEALVHFVIYNDNEIVKLHTCKISIDDRLKEKIQYMLEINIKGCYPRIDPEKELGQESYFITVDNNLSILQELMNIADKLKIMNRQDEFSIYIEGHEKLNIIFIGRVLSMEYIKNEIQRNFSIISEGKKEAGGIPFFKYRKGFLYFFKERENDQ